MPLPPTNLLARESSPYLLQHKDNPVHWRPWSQAALDEVRELSKPILLSIGYAACHWCHVMAHESFEDDTVAAVMNELFVNIKVDREERPDIDQIYMAALNATGEQGGWPLTMFLTPDGRPFWGGTYFPREPRYGRLGFVDVLRSVHRAFTERGPDVDHNATALSSHVSERLAASHGPETLSIERLRTLADTLGNLVDPKWGGIRGAPKFPNAPFMHSLWLNWLLTGNARHRDAVIHGVRMMLAGGIYDHVGGGLCRYSTDAEWLVPHFEKMLYDNAQLIRTACWAYAETGDETFRRRIEETVSWLEREMTVAVGGFASSLDADSAGVEGLFYTWRSAAITSVLGPDAAVLLATYDLAAPETWEGDPILHRLRHPESQYPEQENRLDELKTRLRQARETRVRPGRDDKVLVDWNGLMIRALAEAGRIFGRPQWITLADEAFRFITESMDQDGRLPHSISGDRRLFPGLASDYASMINAAVSLFEAKPEQRYVNQAQLWLNCLDRWHGDGAHGYFLTASDAADVPIRIRGDVDEAVPSATSQTVEAMVRLANLTGNHQLHERALGVAEHAMGRALRMQYGQAGIINASALALQPMKLITVDEPSDPRFSIVASRRPDPRRIDIPVPVNGAVSHASLPDGATPDLTRPGAWLCTGQVCLPAIIDPDELEARLRRAG